METGCSQVFNGHFQMVNARLGTFPRTVPLCEPGSFRAFVPSLLELSPLPGQEVSRFCVTCFAYRVNCPLDLPSFIRASETVQPAQLAKPLMELSGLLGVDASTAIAFRSTEIGIALVLSLAPPCLGVFLAQYPGVA
jgi:hypothetical protein